jgi:hypothetical protein
LSLCRLNDDKVGQVPCKGGRPPPIGLAAIALDRRGIAAPLVRSAIPRHDHWEFARFDLERIESTERPAANDDFDGVPFGYTRSVGFLARRGCATFG